MAVSPGARAHPALVHPHRLDPLLRPRSLAIVGASARPGSVGNLMLRQVRQGGFGGAVYAVNPRHREIDGVATFPALAALPETVEHVAFAIGDDQIETELATAIAHGARAATIVSPLDRPGDAEPRLKDRIRDRAREAGLVLCGGNGMGFYNFHDRLWLCGFATRPDHRPGGTALLTHSGSLFTAIVDGEARIDYGLAVSTGQELTTTLADYMDFCLDQPWTRTIGLFIETARDPAGFEAALAKANAQGVPVVALKVGRTETSARLAVSHSGAIAGDHAAYRALFERHGVAEVRSIDEMAATLMVLDAAHDCGPGGLATSHDSGGERGLAADLAADAGVAFARLSKTARAALAACLDHGLEPVNPLDHWGTGKNYPDDFIESFRLIAQDADTAIAALVLDRWVDGEVMPHYRTAAEIARNASGKPVFIVSNHRGTGDDGTALAATRAGIPVIDGVPTFLAAVRHAFAWRDFKAQAAMRPAAPDPAVVTRWRDRLAGPDAPDEAAALAMLADFGLATVPSIVVEDAAAAAAAAARIGYAVVMKTAMPGITHKSDVGGVRLDLADAAAVNGAYADLAARLGPRAVVAPMVAGARVEMLFGMTRDADFGPIVLVGFGGIHAEVLRDVVVAKPPFDAAEARRLIDRLRLRPLLDGVRGALPADLGALAAALARFSEMTTAVGDLVDAIDVNPVLARPDGAVAVDALVVPRRPG